MIKKDNYVLVTGWMITDLDLKGSELLAFALIYGFSQDGESEFSGSVSYVAEWLNTSKRTATKILQTLTDKGLIVKKPIEINRVVFNRYKVAGNFSRGEKTSLPHEKTSLPHEETSPNNINNNINNILDNNIYSSVIGFLNQEAGTNYKPSSDKTRRLIDARLGDGFGEEDFKTVIKKKCAVWKGTEMEKYLRPETLFGTKFEGYLNELESKPKPKNTFSDFGQRNYDYDDLQKKLGGA